MESDVGGEAFNVGSGGEASVREIVELVLELTGSELEPEYDREAKRPDDAPRGQQRAGGRGVRLAAGATISTTGLRDVIAFERAKASV